MITKNHVLLAAVVVVGLLGGGALFVAYQKPETAQSMASLAQSGEHIATALAKAAERLEPADGGVLDAGAE